MPAAPLFSVLMPTHHRPDVISHAIASVLAQSCGDLELLVSGDGATAETARAVTGFADPRVRWFDLPKAPGFGYANRNLALAQARGRYIAFAADDDLLLPGHLAELERLLDTGAALAATRALWISGDGIAAPFPVSLDLPDERSIFLTLRNSVPASCFAYRADALAEAAPWPEQEPHSGDWRLWHRIMRENPARPLACSPDYTVLHFSARRKNARDSHMPELRRCLEFADRAGWWPAFLKPPVPPGASEQGEWLRRMTADAPAFARQLDDAVRLVTDRLAWEYVQSSLPPERRKLAVLPLTPRLWFRTRLLPAARRRIRRLLTSAGSLWRGNRR